MYVWGVALVRPMVRLGEDAHTAGTDEQPDDDQDHAIHDCAADHCHDPANDEDHREQPQDEVHGRLVPGARPRETRVFGIILNPDDHAGTPMTTPAPAAEERTDAKVTLVVPATAEYLRLMRLASADLATRAGFDYEEIEDLKIAVSELCHLLIGAGGSGEVSLELRNVPEGVLIEGHARQPGRLVDNEFSETILDTVVDEHSLEDGDDGRRYRLLKKLRAG